MRFSFPGDSSSLIFDNVNERLVADDRPRRRRGHRLVGRPQRPLQRRDADVRLRHLRPADHGERDAARRQPALDRLRALRRRQGEHADRDVADRHRPGEAQPRARAGAGRHRRERQAARAAPVGRQARAGRGRGRERGPAHDALLEPLPALPVSQLGAREHGLREPAGVEARGAVVDRRRRPSTPTKTGAPVVDGKVYVNNGFWDTYRTTWSAYSLFTPRDGRRAGRRLRPAVPRRRLDRALVVARLREPDDGHELRRRVRRRLRQGRAGARRPRHL